MSEPNHFQSWPRQSKKSWLEHIKNENPKLDLSQVDRSVDAHIHVKAFPFYTDSLQAGSLQNHNESYRPWKCGIHCTLTDPKKDNLYLLHALQNGTEFFHLSCCFALTPNGLDQLLSGIQLDILFIHWALETAEDEIVLSNYILAGYGDIAYSVSYHSRQLSSSKLNDTLCFPVFNTELWSTLLYQWLNQIPQKTNLNNNIHITLQLNTDFLLMLSSARALRLIMDKLNEVLDLSINPFYELQVDSNVLDNVIGTNLIQLSSIALSASLSGADAIALPATDHLVETKNYKWLRSSIHLLQILKYESYLDRSVDPLAGSYSVEDLTEQIASSLWQSLQFKLKNDQ